MSKRERMIAYGGAVWKPKDANQSVSIASTDEPNLEWPNGQRLPFGHAGWLTDA
jgi:hypothetical protein